MTKKGHQKFGEINGNFWAKMVAQKIIRKCATLFNYLEFFS